MLSVGIFSVIKVYWKILLFLLLWQGKLAVSLQLHLLFKESGCTCSCNTWHGWISNWYLRQAANNLLWPPIHRRRPCDSPTHLPSGWGGLVAIYSQPMWGYTRLGGWLMAIHSGNVSSAQQYCSRGIPLKKKKHYRVVTIDSEKLCSSLAIWFVDGFVICVGLTLFLEHQEGQLACHGSHIVTV